ncbi:ABC transporter substrate-binding protein [Clostridium sp. P21]|uniref:ABC transporter substrate-binding protein n=1 Tax=Clostridium muellerianum TaxID=2716538 RepID=A0A7Y0EKH0_9CLOT|nr:ABC transporter substrate-binding protein [Clostridium muellerianum]NMM65153.1 ABC transporter substrate-binding protein [Clostridium muellerianum]
MFKLKKISFLLIALVFAFSLIGCAKNNTTAPSNEDKSQIEATKNTTYPLKIKDSLNRKITIEKEPSKVISVAPNITETIYALNKENTLIGRTDFCTYPKEASKIQSIGTLTGPNIEKITSLKPDIVIASNHFREQDLKKLEELNIKVVVLSGPESFENTYDIIKNVGKILNANSKAASIVSNMMKKVDYVKEKVKGKDTPSTYYVVGFGKNGDFTSGKDTFIGRMITIAGGKNAASDITEWKYSIEKLVEKNPDILICSNKFNSKNGIKNEQGYKDLDAVKKNKLFEIDEDIINRQGPRLADGLEAMAKIIHPEAFK